MKDSIWRYHIEHYFFYHPLSVGDVDVIQLGRSYCEPGSCIADHMHQDWFELTVVTNGSGTVTANGKSTVLTAGQTHLSFPHEIHKLEAAKDESFEYDFFSFYPTRSALKDALFHIASSCKNAEARVFRDERILFLINCILQEFNVDGLPYSEQAKADIIDQILLYTVRNFSSKREQRSSVASKNEVLCYQLMHYIDTHLYSIKSLSEVATALNYNYSYLSALFKKETGKTLSEYDRAKRMEAAKTLIMEHKKTVEEIAYDLNYASVFSFSKAFKAAVGVSPEAYRKLHAKKE